MKIHVTARFEKLAKKLHRNQIKLIEDAIEAVVKNPAVGESKKGDLMGVKIYKFHIYHQLVLLAYLYNEEEQNITFLSFGSHENFYRDLKKS